MQRRFFFRWLLLALLVAGTASANGRFPRAQRLVESAEKSETLALYGTYGLIVSSDAGLSWRHICEAATGPYTGEDPLLELMPGSKIVLRTESALVRSEASWCDFGPILGSEAEQIQDITRDPTRPDVILALTAGFVEGTGFVTHFTASGDAGASWPTKKELPRANIARGLSLDVAPSRPVRVYVTGLDADGQGQLLVSDDGGNAFVGRPIPGTHANAAPYLAFVSKKDADVLFVRTDTYEEVDGIDTAGDSLLLSTDAGLTWQPILKHRAKLLGVALSPDEETLLAGYGDPVVAATYLEPEDVGLYRARADAVLANPAQAESAFEKIYEASVTCLRWTAAALYACTSQTERGFEVGKRADAEFALGGAEPFTSLLRLPEMTPLSCGEGTDGHACYTDPDNGFAAVCTVFQASCDVTPPPPAPDGGVPSKGGAPSTGGISGAAGVAAGASSGGAVGSGGAGGSGGTAGAPSSAGGAGGAAPGGGESSDGSCACRAASAREPARAAWLALLGAGFALRRRRSARGATLPFPRAEGRETS